jgi:uncharacterized membrane protein
METIGEAWNWFRAEMGLWVLATLLMLLITFGCAIPFYGMAFATMFGNPDPNIGDMMMFYVWSIPAAIMIYVGQAIGFAGMYNMAIKQIQGQPISMRDFFDFKGMFWQHAGLVISMAIMFGSIACYLPAFMLGGLLIFTQPIIVHQRIGAFAALSQSWNLLKGQIWMAAAFYFILSMVAGLGVVVCCVGLLFTYPLYPLAVSLVYRDYLTAHYGSSAPEAAPTGAQ